MDTKNYLSLFPEKKEFTIRIARKMVPLLIGSGLILPLLILYGGLFKLDMKIIYTISILSFIVWYVVSSYVSKIIKIDSFYNKIKYLRGIP
jgi:hypothetical protein